MGKCHKLGDIYTEYNSHSRRTEIKEVIMLENHHGPFMRPVVIKTLKPGDTHEDINNFIEEHKAKKRKNK